MQEAQETEHRPDSDSDEINLYALFQVIWKRKSLIIAIFLIAVIAAAIISFILPPVYRVMAIVSPGWIDIDTTGKAIYLDSAENIKSLIEGEAFCTKIRESLKLDPTRYSHMHFKVELKRNTEALVISYDTGDPAQGKIIMGELMKELIEYYKARTDTRKDMMVNSIEMMKNQNVLIENKKMQNINSRKRIANQKIRIQNEKKRIRDYIELLTNKIDLLKVTESNLQSQLKGVENNTKVILNERGEMLKKGEKADSVGLLLYSNTVQQNISYMTSMQASLQENRLQQDSTKNEHSRKEIELQDKDTELNDADLALRDLDAELKNLDSQILDNLTRIQNLELQKLRIEGLRIIQEPFAGTKPVGPRKRLNVAIAGVTSLFFGIFLVFFLEFLKKGKQNEQKQQTAQ